MQIWKRKWIARKSRRGFGVKGKFDTFTGFRNSFRRIYKKSLRSNNGRYW